MAGNFLIAADTVPAHRIYGTWRSGLIGGGGYLQHVVWAPSNPQRMYLTSDVGGCWRSDDGGRTWNCVNKSDAWHAAVDWLHSERVVMNGSTGVFYSADAGTTWQPLDKSLPYRHARNVVAFAGERIIVGTGGNGFAWTPVPQKK